MLELTLAAPPALLAELVVAVLVVVLPLPIFVPVLSPVLLDVFATEPVVVVMPAVVTLMLPPVSALVVAVLAGPALVLIAFDAVVAIPPPAPDVALPIGPSGSADEQAQVMKTPTKVRLWQCPVVRIGLDDLSYESRPSLLTFRAGSALEKSYPGTPSVRKPFPAAVQ